MIKCKYLEKEEGWCRNEGIDMYMDYPSEHYCKNCSHQKEEEDDTERHRTTIRRENERDV